MTRYRSTLRLDTRTGRLEWVSVEAVDADVYDPEHDAEHARAAGEFGRLLDPHPVIREIRPGDERPPGLPTGLTATEEPEPETRANRTTE
jgi:hypothetical protein